LDHLDVIAAGLSLVAMRAPAEYGMHPFGSRASDGDRVLIETKEF
jgi:hypothetical protein